MDLRVGRFQYYSIFPRGTSSTLGPSEQHTCVTEGGTRCGWNSGFPNPGGCQAHSCRPAAHAGNPSAPQSHNMGGDHVP